MMNNELKWYGRKWLIPDFISYPGIIPVEGLRKTQNLSG
jgi:hypothetical protein